MIRPALLAAVLCLPFGAAFADNGSPVPVRVGSHTGYGRVVFDLHSHTDYQLTQQGQHVIVQFSADVSIGSAATMPHNVSSISGGTGQAELVVASGTTVRAWRLGDRIVIDVLDAGVSAPPAASASASVPVTAGSPPQAAAPPQASAPPQAAAPPARDAKPEPVSNAARAPADVPPSAPAADKPPAPVEAANTVPPEPASSPAVAADQQADSEPAQVATLDVPFTAPLGVAAFRRGNFALVVFDQPLAVDLRSVHDDPVLGTATVETAQNATVLRLRLDPASGLTLSHGDHSWRIGSTAPATVPRPIAANAVDGRLVLQAATPGGVVAVADPDSGATLLVGTQRRDGEGTPIGRQTPDFALLPTWQGVVVAPLSDTVMLHPTQSGFVLTAGAGGLALSSAPDGSAAAGPALGLTRRFDFGSQPTETRIQVLRRQIAEAALTPVLARGPQRDLVARSMIALGLGAEAQAVLRVAAAEDPRQAGSPDNAALASIAALLAHRPNEAAGLDDARLPEADDIALWRAVRQAYAQPDSAAAAAVFASSLPLLLAYPPTLRDRILPLVAENLVAGGELQAAAGLLDARKDDATLDFARARLLETKSDVAGALAAYDRLAQSPDRLIHARAAVRAVELRLASNAIDMREAAGRLDRLLYAWRGDGSELALRERVADLRARSGEWRAALALLRENETLFPSNKDVLHAKLSDMFAAFLRSNAADTLSPLELVSLADENVDLLPQGTEGEALQARLADRLLALDLPSRAGPVLQKLMTAAPSGAGRAGFGARLAAMRLREGDAANAEAALAASDAADLPPELAERRALLLAEANARRGDAEHALASLEAVKTAAADEARATILERANNWPAAQHALSDYAAKVVPADGALDDGQRRTMLRLATAAARAGDDATLGSLRRRETRRMGSGPLADMFRLLTADQVRTPADLKRSGQEAVLARGLPNGLKALQPGQTR